MKPERWREIEQLFHAALQQEPALRESFLTAACGNDEDLYRQVVSLLSETRSTGVWAVSGDRESPVAGFEIPALPEGLKLGPYQIVGPLGEGGMGRVYRALDTRLGRAVAVKISSDQFSKRFEREARAISALNHPNICTLFDVGSLPSGAWYMVTELVEGETLRDWLRHSPALERKIGVGRQVLDALRAAHEAGIVHRDLKPDNIMLRFDGHVKVLDFGLAKWVSGPDGRANADTRADFTTPGQSTGGQILGTVAYMPPERLLGQEVDARGDLFAFGVILYEMITQRHPWPRKANVDTMHAILHEDPPPIGAHLSTAAIERVTWKCLEKQPERRFQTAVELRLALDQAAAEPAAKTAERKSSIAVLPFVNMSADRENGYFSDGLTEEVINALAQTPGMKVAGRTSSFFFRGKDVESREIGMRLGVEHILEGSVRRAGNRIRVTAQLIKATDGFHVWSERYDSEMTDIFTIQDEITQAISQALRMKLAPEAGSRPRHEPNLRAYEACFKAREHWFKGTAESQARFQESIERAVELDPKFALPYVLLGGQYSMLAHRGIRPAREVIPLAQAAEEEALRLDPSQPEAHALLGVWAGTFSYDWNEARRRWRLAMVREPVSRDISFWYGNHYLLPMGRPHEAVEAMERGLEGDPLNLLYRHHLAVGLRDAGRPEDAEAELRKVLEVDENFPPALGTLGAVCAQQERFEEALALTERARSLMPWSNPIVGQLAALLFRTRDRGRADTLIEKLRPGKAYGAPTGLALFHALCGEPDRAAEWTEQAIEERYPELIKILGPFLRSTPYWPALAKRMNLAG